jgi:hypothetical protein
MLTCVNRATRRLLQPTTTELPFWGVWAPCLRTHQWKVRGRNFEKAGEIRRLILIGQEYNIMMNVKRNDIKHITKFERLDPASDKSPR